MTRRWCTWKALRIAGLATALAVAVPAARAAEEFDGRSFYFGELHAHAGMSGDGEIDEGTFVEDADGDGYSELEGDCDDNNASVFPGAPILCDGIPDNDCDGEPDDGERDEDGDGVTGCDGDCDDTNPDVFPGAEDICDGVWDNNCDHVADALEVDDDGDGYSECQGDCDDELDWVYPAAPEYLNEIDDDCDGEIDEGFEEDTGCALFESGLPFCSLGPARATPRGALTVLALAVLLAARRRTRS